MTSRKPSDVDGVAEGAPAPIFDKGRDLDETRKLLAPWLAERLEVPHVEIGEMTWPIGAGSSNETIIFDAAANGVTKGLVLRVHPAPDQQFFLDTRFREQFDLLSVLGSKQLVRVAEVYWFEADESLLGRPFFVMERLRGNVPVSMPVYNSRGFLFDATPQQRRTLWLSALHELARIHNVPVSDVAFLDRGELGPTGLEQQLAYCDRWIPWALPGGVPEVMAQIRQWLGDHLPASRTDGLAWGDSRIGNMMFADDFTVAGVMDWEQANLGGAMQDIGWWLFFDDYHSLDHGLARLDGLGTRQETIDLWQELTGRRVVDLHWYEVFAGYQLSCLAMPGRRASKQPVQRVVRNQFLVRTCHLLDLDLPQEYAP